MYKVTVALLATLAVAAALHIPNVRTGATDNAHISGQDVAQRQKLVLQLLRNVGQKNMYPELLALGKSWNPEQMIDRYANQWAVKNFVSMWKQGTLPRGEIFHVYNDSHLKEVVALFDMLYFAKDFDTFIKTAAWARDNVNESQFAYAFSVAVVHRDDCAGLVLPPLYEVAPQLYLHSGDIMDFVSAKMQGQINYVKMTNWTAGYEISNPEQLLGYFTEDVGVNAYHAYAHLYMPFWLNCEKYGITTCQIRGESFYYYYQQILARYNLQRMANYLPELEDFDWEESIKTGYNPDLLYPNGAHFPVRADQQDVSSIQSYSVQDIKAIEQRIKDAIDSGFVLGKDGNKIPITQYVKGINILGNIIEGNQDSVNSRYYGSYQTMIRNLLALIMDPSQEHGVAPGVIGHYETALRDPAFYILQKYVLGLFQQYQNNLPSYKPDDLIFSGVAVKDVAVDKLVTYFDLFDIDVTNAVDVATIDELDKLNYVAKTMRLNHQPFSYKIKVASDKKTSAVVRVFLGPSTELTHSNFYGEQASDVYYGHDTADLDRLRNYFVELDRFPVELKNGDNLIERNSREFTSTVGDNVSFKSLLKSAESGNTVLSTVDQQCGFPDRLVLPMGHKAGIPYSLFVMVTPHGADEHDHADYYHSEKYQAAVKDIYSCNGLMTVVDNRPLGFPFDRQIDNFGRFYMPNMYFKDVVIFHKDSSADSVVFKKNVNDFDAVYAQAGGKHVPSHRLMDEEILREDDDVRAFL
ncbi:allergen Cr-PI-like [Thrips palmi]|uniref:Allergen Cr-PI-like n=1 Tax=Thrips palmi TaxID=161013 RepID=A0A6P8YN16_THRPL|nr:allergen Cr-PI-like [Thrips palmi]